MSKLNFNSLIHIIIFIAKALDNPPELLAVLIKNSKKQLKN